MGDKWHLSVDYICILSPLVCTFLYLLPAGEDDRPFQQGGNVGVVPGRQQQPWQSPPNLAEGPQRPPVNPGRPDPGSQTQLQQEALSSFPRGDICLLCTLTKPLGLLNKSICLTFFFFLVKADVLGQGRYPEAIG